MADLFLKYTGTDPEGNKTYQAYDADDRLTLHRPLFEITELEAERDETCKWQHDLVSTDSYAEYDSWATSCGESFAILEEWHEKPTEFCSNCGKKVEAE